MATALNRSISATVKTDVALVRIAKKDFVAVALDIMSILAGRAPPTGRFDHNNSDSRSL